MTHPTADTRPRCTRCRDLALYVTNNNAGLKRYTCAEHLEAVEYAIAALGEGTVTLMLGEDTPGYETHVDGLRVTRRKIAPPKS